MSFNLNSLWLDWRAKVPDGVPNPSNAYHLVLLKELCLSKGIDTKTTDSVILFLEKKVDDEDVIKYKQDGESKEMKAGSAKTMDKEHPAKIEYDKLKGSDDEDEEEDKPEPMKIDANPFDKEDDEDKEGGEEKKNPQSKREDTINKVLDLFVPADEQQTGAGRFAMTQEDVDDYKDWLKLTSEEREAKQKEIVEKQKEKIGEVSETDIDDFESRLKEKLGKEKFKSLMSSIRKKGDPPSKYLKGKYPKGHPKEGQGIGRDRERQVIRHYLETGGVNPMNGKPVPFSEAQLDHITSLDNGGKDGGENWMWMEARINQFKGSLTDTEVESKLIERDLKTANELDKETSEAELKNWQTQAEIAYWETRFEGNNIANLSVESIDSMNADEVTNLVKAWNRYVGDGDPRYIARYGTRKAEVDGKQYPITRDGAMQPDKDNPNTWGIQKQPDGTLKKTDMTYEEALAAYEDARASGGAKIGNEEVKENITIALTGVQSPFKDDEGNSITIPTKSEEDAIDEELEAIQGEKAERKQYIKDLQKDIRANPQSADNLKKQIEKDPEYKKYKEDMKKAAGKGKAKKPDNPEEYARLKKEYDEWRLNKWRGWQSLLQKNN
jgi:hypothetical protein